MQPHSVCGLFTVTHDGGGLKEKHNINEKFHFPNNRASVLMIPSTCCHTAQMVLKLTD